MKNNIKIVREQKNLTQKDCADIFGVTLRAWQTYEQGVSEPKYEVLCKIADFFNVTLDYLLGREPPEPKIITPSDEELEAALLEAYRTLPEDARKDFLDHIRKAVLAEQNGGVYVERTLGELEDELKARAAEREKGGKFA